MLQNIAKAIISSGINKLASKTCPYSHSHMHPFHMEGRENTSVPAGNSECYERNSAKAEIGRAWQTHEATLISTRKQAEQPICQALSFLEQTSCRKLLKQARAGHTKSVTPPSSCYLDNGAIPGQRAWGIGRQEQEMTRSSSWNTKVKHWLPEHRKIHIPINFSLSKSIK